MAKKFKQKCLHVRVFGYPSASQLDLDSFVLFSNSAEMKVCPPSSFAFTSNNCFALYNDGDSLKDGAY